MQSKNEKKIEKVKELLKTGMKMKEALDQVKLPAWIWYGAKRKGKSKKKPIVHEISSNESFGSLVTVFQGTPEAVAQVVRSLQ